MNHLSQRRYIFLLIFFFCIYNLLLNITPVQQEVGLGGKYQFSIFNPQREIELAKHPERINFFSYFFQAFEAYDQIAAQCIQNDTKFVDPDFPPAAISIYGHAGGKNSEWVRISHEIDSQACVMFSGYNAIDIR